MATIAAVGLAYHKYGGHCGLYYENRDGKIELLHLVWHNKLRSEPPSAFYEDIDSRFPRRERFVISDLSRLIFEKYESEGLRFAVTRNDGFLPNGRLKLDEPGTGFSCATFVKAIFDAAGLPLIDSKTWPVADNADRKWFASHVDAMGRSFPAARDQDHISRLDVACKWSRYRPEQVAFAAKIAPPAAKYSAVKIPAELLLREVMRHHEPLPLP